MTGDGVNDVLALKSADIRTAMGITGTEVIKETGEMILGDDSYSTIVAAVVPLPATQILWINLVTDSGPALAMGVDPETDDVMGRGPRKLTDRIIDTHMWQRIIGVGMVMGLLTLLIYDLTLPGGLVGGLEDLATPDSQFAVARTTVFTALVFMQLFNALNSRSDTGSAFTHMLSNAWLWGSVALVAVLQVLVVEVPFLQSAFGTAPLDWIHWAVAVGAGAAVLLYEEVVKLLRRTFRRILTSGRGAYRRDRRSRNRSNRPLVILVPALYSLGHSRSGCNCPGTVP